MSVSRVKVDLEGRDRVLQTLRLLEELRTLYHGDRTALDLVERLRELARAPQSSILP